MLQILLRSPMFLKALIALAAVTLSAPSALAQGGPPLLTDDPGTPGAGRWEINLASTIERRRSEWFLEAPLLDINYGVGDRIQLKFELPWLILNEGDDRIRSGLGNSLVGVKWRFADEDRHGVAVSVYPQLEFNNPTTSARRGLVEEGTQLLLPVQVARRVGVIGVNAEIGYGLVQHRSDEWVYGLAFGYSASERFELLGEIHGAALRDFSEDNLVFNLGTRWKVNNKLVVLGSAGRSFRDPASGVHPFLAYIGIQFNF
jgi:hypothetical protein